MKTIKRVLGLIASALMLTVCFSFASCDVLQGLLGGDSEGVTPPTSSSTERFAGVSVRLEAENGSAFQGTKVNDAQTCPWASNASFIGGFDKSSKATLSFSVYCSEAAEVELVFCVANTTTNTIFLDTWSDFLSINDVNYKFSNQDLIYDRNVSKGDKYCELYPAYTATAPYMIFDTTNVVIELEAGYNTIAFSGQSTTLNFDYIELTPESDRIVIMES